MGGGGAGAYYEGSLTITSDVSLTFNAGGSYKISTITSTILNVIAGYGGRSFRSLPGGEDGNNGSSGGGGIGTSHSLYPAGSGDSPGTNGGTAFQGTNVRAGGGGGGAGGQGGNASSSVGGAGGNGITPTNRNGINQFYTTPLCVGGQGGTTTSAGASSSTYGSGAGGRDGGGSTYYYGQPGAIIIAVPKT